jgi:hypothetical protein
MCIDQAGNVIVNCYVRAVQRLGLSWTAWFEIWLSTVMADMMFKASIMLQVAANRNLTTPTRTTAKQIGLQTSSRSTNTLPS